MEEPLLAKTIHALVFICICTTIIIIGWNEPLRYRFMSPGQIVEVEGVREEPERQEWRPTSSAKGTALDRAPYEVKSGKLKYSENFDSRKMGAPTETDRRGNTTGKQ